MHWWRDNRGKVILTLVALWVGALISHFSAIHLYEPLLAVVATCCFDAVLSLLRKRQFVVTESSFVTGLLVGLIGEGAVFIVVASFLSILSKQIIGRGDHRHIFNPAALGVFAASLLLRQSPAWWGSSWGIVAVVIVVIGVTWEIVKLHRIWMPLTFIALYYLATRSVALTFDGTVFLFAFIMLPEPTTSVSGGVWTYGWGILVGGLVILQTLFPILPVDPLLLSLLVANAVGAAKRFL